MGVQTLGRFRRWSVRPVIGRTKPKDGNKVEALLRFSTVADVEHDFAMKFQQRKATGTWSVTTPESHESPNRERPEENSHDRR